MPFRLNTIAFDARDLRALSERRKCLTNKTRAEPTSSTAIAGRNRLGRLEGSASSGRCKRSCREAHHGGSLQFAPYGIIAPPTMIQINAISATPGIVLILTAQNPPRPPRGYRQELETAGHTAAFFIGQRIEPKPILRARPRYSRCQPRAIIPSTVRATPYEERFRARLALMPSRAARAWRKRRSAQAIGTRARTHHRANRDGALCRLDAHAPGASGQPDEEIAAVLIQVGGARRHAIDGDHDPARRDGVEARKARPRA